MSKGIVAASAMEPAIPAIAHMDPKVWLGYSIVIIFIIKSNIIELNLMCSFYLKLRASKGLPNF